MVCNDPLLGSSSSSASCLWVGLLFIIKHVTRLYSELIGDKLEHTHCQLHVHTLGSLRVKWTFDSLNLFHLFILHTKSSSSLLESQTSQLRYVVQVNITSAVYHNTKYNNYLFTLVAITWISC